MDNFLNPVAMAEKQLIAIDSVGPPTVTPGSSVIAALPAAFAAHSFSCLVLPHQMKPLGGGVLWHLDHRLCDVTARSLWIDIACKAVILLVWESASGPQNTLGGGYLVTVSSWGMFLMPLVEDSGKL